MASPDISAQPGLLEVDRERVLDMVVIRWSRLSLLISMSMLALAPLFISDTYSPIVHTLSESGGQGVPGAWIHRSGVILTAVAVLALATCARSVWSRKAKLSLRVYSMALVSLAVFPESPWHGGPHDATVARLHTVAGVVGAVSFILGVIAVSATRQQARWPRVYDAVAVLAVVLVPHLMLLWSFDGLLQRSMVVIGFGWLLLECNRLLASARLSSRVQSF